MTKHAVKKWLGLTAAALLLAACGNGDAEVKAMVKQMHMSKLQSAAFSACVKDMKSKKPIFITGETAVQMTKVPLEVCACHSQTIAKLFKDDKLSGHTRFADYISKKKRKPELKLGRRDLRTAMDPAKGGALLVASFRTCADDFVNKNAELSKGLIVPFELPKKKPKKIEGEDGTDAAAAPAEAVTKS